MAARFPIDNDTRKTASRACAIVHYFIDSDHWLYREDTEIDVGRDCVLELSENNRWLNHKIECQIKGTKKPVKLKREDAFSFPLETKTIMYALNSANAFVLFYVDVTNEVVYYLPIQDYFIADKKRFDKLDGNQDTINVHIPIDNMLSEKDSELQDIARSTYVDGPSKKLKKHE